MKSEKARRGTTALSSVLAALSAVVVLAGSEPAGATTSNDQFVVFAGGTVGIAASGGINQTASEQLSASGILGDPQGGAGSAPYTLAAGPGVARATLSGSFTNPALLTFVFTPQAEPRARTTLTVAGPAGALSASLNLRAQGTVHHLCASDLNCSTRVIVQVKVPGRTLFTEVSTSSGTVRNELGLTVTPAGDGFAIGGEVTTPPFPVNANQPFDVELIVRIDTRVSGKGFARTSTWDHDFAAEGGGVSFSASGPVLNVPAGYDVSGSSVVGNRWRDPFVPPANHPPDAVDDSATVAAPSSGDSIPVLANDSDPDGDPLTVASATQPTNGTVSVFADGSGLRYTPAAGFTGVDSFTYTISDGNGATDTATVSVTVEPPATITVVKELVPADDPGRFELSVSTPAGDLTAVLASLNNAGDGATLGPVTVPAVPDREYTVSETMLPQIQLNDYQRSLVCVEAAAGGTNPASPVSNPDDSRAVLVVAPGDDWTCTITNVRRTATITVVKELLPADDPGRFELSVSTPAGDLTAVLASLNNAGDGATLGPVTVPAVPDREYTVSETMLPQIQLNDYQRSLVCVEAAAGGTNPASPVSNPDESRAVLVVAPGDDWTCTITNVRIDRVPPVVTGVPDREPNALGWYKAPVTIDWQAVDPEPSSGTPTDPPDTLAAQEGRDVAYRSEPSCDPAGNCAQGELLLSIDLTPPTITCDTPMHVIVAGSTIVPFVGASVEDNLSGAPLPRALALPDTSTVGEQTVVFTERDLAGNETTQECPYRVEYRFEGFDAPVRNAPEFNVVTAGRTVPLKWRLTDASGAPVTDLEDASLTTAARDCDLGTPGEEIPEEATGGSGLQNLGDGYYQLNWQTPRSYAGSCKTLQLDLGEGIDRTALFRFT